MPTKYISILLLCVAIVLTGFNAAAESRRKIKLLGQLAEFFGELGRNIKSGAGSFLYSLAAVKERTGAVFSFPSETLQNYAPGCELAGIWRAAVENDECVGKTGRESAAAICTLSDFFADTSPLALADACAFLSTRFAEERARRAAEYAKNERLILTGSLLGAAAVFIIMI